MRDDYDYNENRSFWATIPGMLTALAAVITAITGLVTVLYQVDVLPSGEGVSPTPSAGVSRVSTPTSPPPSEEPPVTESPSPTPESPTHWLGDVVEVKQRVNVSSQKFERGWIFGLLEYTIAIYDDGEGFGAIVTATEAVQGPEPKDKNCDNGVGLDRDYGPWYGFGYFWCISPQDVRDRLGAPLDEGQTETVEVTQFEGGYSFSTSYGSFEVQEARGALKWQKPE